MDNSSGNNPKQYKIILDYTNTRTKMSTTAAPAQAPTERISTKNMNLLAFAQLLVEQKVISDLKVVLDMLQVNDYAKGSILNENVENMFWKELKKYKKGYQDFMKPPKRAKKGGVVAASAGAGADITISEPTAAPVQEAKKKATDKATKPKKKNNKDKEQISVTYEEE
jgi:hypothetical protein